MSLFEQMKPPMAIDMVCCLCAGSIEFIGHDAAPLSDGRCCDDCFPRVESKRIEIASVGRQVQLIRNRNGSLVGIFSSPRKAIRILREDLPCSCSRKHVNCLKCSSRGLVCETIALDILVDDSSTDMED